MNEILLTITVIAFLIGLWLGKLITVSVWKRNAKTYIGIEGYKVITHDFYDYDVVKKYQEYLETKTHPKCTHGMPMSKPCKECLSFLQKSGPMNQPSPRS